MAFPLPLRIDKLASWWSVGRSWAFWGVNGYRGESAENFWSRALRLGKRHLRVVQQSPGAAALGATSADMLDFALTPLVALDVAWNIEDAAGYVQQEILPLLPGEAWKGSGEDTQR